MSGIPESMQEMLESMQETLASEHGGDDLYPRETWTLSDLGCGCACDVARESVASKGSSRPWALIEGW